MEERNLYMMTNEDNKGDSVNGQKERNKLISRRSMLKESGIFLLGGTLGCASKALSPSAAAPTGGNAPPLPWPWVKLDPMEAGRRTYRSYFKEDG